MADEILFGAIAVGEGFLTRPDLEDALRNQGIAKLGDYLVSRGRLTREQVEAILDIQKINIADRVEAAEAGGLFGQIAVRAGFVTASQVATAVRRQLELGRGGTPAMIGQLLLQMGALTQDQFLEVLRRQDRAAVRCDGCRTHYLVEGLSPGTKFLCRKCLRVVTVPVVAAPAAAVVHHRIGAETFGPYAIEAEVGRSSWSATFRANQRELGRRVALRILRTHAPEPWIIEHLRSVAAQSTSVDHPGYIPTIEVGTVEGIAFLSRAWVDGEPYAAVMAKDRPLPAQVELLERVARVVHRANERGAVHGNLRPSNLFFEGGEPRVVDAGLARLHDSLFSEHAPAPLLTRSPEQIAGAFSLDARTDVYGLGMLLYDLLAGRSPFRRGTLEDVRDAILHQDPPPPSEIDAEAPRELEALCLAALAKERDERPATAADFADDLARWRAGQPVRARAPGRRRWLRKFFE
jgi:hypothetical protein